MGGLLHLMLQASVPALCGINLEVVQENMRAFSSGVDRTARDILGLAGGPLLPSLFMSLIEFAEGWDTSESVEDEKMALCYGMGFLLLCNLCNLFIMDRAFTEATKVLESQWSLARKRLQEPPLGHSTKHGR